MPTKLLMNARNVTATINWKKSLDSSRTSLKTGNWTLIMDVMMNMTAKNMTRFVLFLSVLFRVSIYRSLLFNTSHPLLLLIASNKTVMTIAIIIVTVVTGNPVSSSILVPSLDTNIGLPFTSTSHANWPR